MTRQIPAVLAALLLAGCSSSEPQQDNGKTLALPAFTGIAISTPGQVVIAPYGQHYVHVDGDSPGLARFTAEVVDGVLVVGCGEYCTEALNLEIGLASLNELQLQNGAKVRIKQGFQPVPRLILSLSQGGTLDATALTGQAVQARIFGGGLVQLHAAQRLDVQIMQGGTVFYRGEPSIRQSILGGGKVESL